MQAQDNMKTPRCDATVLTKHVPQRYVTYGFPYHIYEMCKIRATIIIFAKKERLKG